MGTHGLLRVIGCFACLTAATVFGPGTSSGRAQTEPVAPLESPVAKTSEPTADEVQARIKKLEENAELDPAVKAKLVETYNKALASLRAAAESVAQGEQFAKLTRDAPAALQALQLKSARPMSDQPPSIPTDATSAQLQQMLSQAELDWGEAQKSLQALQDEPKRRADRRLEIPKRAEAAKLQLQELDAQLEVKPAPDEPPETTAARRAAAAKKKALAAEAAAEQAELQYYEATGELLSAQRDWAARRVAELEARVKSLRSVVNERRRHEAERQAMEALVSSAQSNQAVGSVAEVNASLANVRKTLVDKLEHAAAELERVVKQEATLEDQYKRIVKRYETAGDSEAIGLLLRKQRDELPETESHRRNIRQRATEIAQTYLELIEYEERRNDLATLDVRVKEMSSASEAVANELERKVLEAEIRSVLEAQRSLYDSLIADLNGYLETLAELDLRELKLIETVAAFAKYCDERILWIPSATVFDAADLRQLGRSLKWFFDPAGWRAAGEAWWADTRRHPTLTAAAACGVLLLLVGRGRLRKATMQLGEQAARNNIVSYRPTLQAMLTTSLSAVLWPGLAAYVGLRLTAFDGATDFSLALGRGLTTTAPVFATLELLRQVCRKNGLGEAHFAWDKDAVRLVRRTVWTFLAFGLPAVFVVSVTEAQSSEAIKSSLGRAAFVAALVVLTACLHRVMRPTDGAFDGAYAAAPQSWMARLRYVWHWLALGTPISFAVLAIVGYYYTALVLASRLTNTLWLVIGATIVYAALIRWSLLSYRYLAMRNVRERKAADAAAAATPAAATPPSAVAVKSRPELTLSDINKQTRKALQLATAVGLLVGVWFVWIDVLPALRTLGDFPLWTVETPGPADAELVLKPVTTADLLLAVVVASLTIAAARHLPGLLEIAVLQRLPLEPSVRYAVSTVCKYAITAVGLVTAFGVIGIGWSKVQWLVAAVGVGLGFGLQEIFANFISGLILLVERPVRLGDIVTVGDVTGHVTRIQMRATTITDWDMRELVVPNKEFITGRLMNWTLSSTVSRMSITVGVAYGTDPDLVRTLLLRIAGRHPLVLKEPPPHALLDAFADSTLNFVLRVYMTSRDVFLQLRHELMTDVAREFRQAGIEIAFPQRDLHLRSVDPASRGLLGGAQGDDQPVGSQRSDEADENDYH